jgi:hypothetical protein
MGEDDYESPRPRSNREERHSGVEIPDFQMPKFQKNPKSGNTAVVEFEI